MPIPFNCPCGATFTAPDSAAGQWARCKRCNGRVQVPALPPADDEEAAMLLAGDDAPPPSLPSKPTAVDAVEPRPRLRVVDEAEPRPRPKRPRERSETPRPLPTLPVDRAGDWREYGYFLLILTLLPLACVLIVKTDDSLQTRLQETVSQLSPHEQEQFIGKLQNIKSRDDLIDVLPQHKLASAHLSGHTFVHWLYAALAAAVFTGMCQAVFVREEADSRAWHLLLVGVTTATAGVCLLFMLQGAASSGAVPIGGGIVGLIGLFIRFIGFSYSAALDPENGFWPSAFGFTFGVGYCEEAIKLLPVFMCYRVSGALSWRSACLWGLTSGLGFGISEGVMYSAQDYNGFSPVSIYVVRFVSCVALHGMWSAAAAITLHHAQGVLHDVEHWVQYIFVMMSCVAVPMVLHGLYDTLLKKDMPGVALVVALASFAWLAWQIERARSAEAG